MKFFENNIPIDDAAIAEALRNSGEPIAQFFSYSHLPPHLAAVSRGFAIMALLTLELPRNAERSAGLRKLIEAKDCAVRAAIAK